MKIDKELLKGSTSILILSLLEGEDMYGYQIARTLKEKSDQIFDMKEGTMYPMLHGLEDQKAIESYWLDTGNRRRRYYKITQDGLNLLRHKKDEWQTFTNAINTVIEYFSHV
ncbi:MAG: helix-turn-helix transcriptional regulator [Clostridiales bacterium]|jgi:PadR family transcriptional regulator PadR|nr:helix-turn-helix transcriptional regulator [Clostridiales bacterium]